MLSDELTDVENGLGEKLTKKQVHDRNKLSKHIGSKLKVGFEKRGSSNDIYDDDSDDEE